MTEIGVERKYARFPMRAAVVSAIIVSGALLAFWPITEVHERGTTRPAQVPVGSGGDRPAEPRGEPPTVSPPPTLNLKTRRAVVRVTRNGVAEASAELRVSLDHLKPVVGQAARVVVARTGPDGSTELSLEVPDGSAIGTVWAASDDGHWAGSALLRVDRVASTEIRLRRVGGVVKGRITNLAEGEASRTTVHAYCPGWPEAPGRRPVPVDANGHFTVGGIHHFITLFAVTEGRSPSSLWSSEVEAGTEQSVELAVGPPSREARLRAVMEDGRPLPAGAPVLARTGDSAYLGSVVDEDGWVTFSNLEPGSHLDIYVPPRKSAGTGAWLTARWEQKLEAWQWQGMTEVRIPLALRSRFRVLAADGRPVPGLPVEMRRVEAEEVVADAGAESVPRTDGAGFVDPFREVPALAGEYELSTPSAGVIWRGPLLAGGGEAPVIPVQLKEWGFLQVSVVDSRGEPCHSPNVGVGILPASRRGESNADEIPTGFSRLGGEASIALLIPEGREWKYLVRVIARYVGVVDAPPDSRSPMTIRLPFDTGAVRVTMTESDPRGKPFLFRIRGADRPQALAFLPNLPTASGDYVYRPLPCGNFSWELVLARKSGPPGLESGASLEVTGGTPVMLPRSDAE
jgi:hypothetical protein